ncbi:MAG: glutaredoxin family protein [Puniceicoccales bacterium]
MKYLLLFIAFAGIGYGLYHYSQNEELQAEAAAVIDNRIVLTDKTGRELDCEVVSMGGDTVDVIRAADGQAFTIQLDTLSASSQAALAGLKLVGAPKKTVGIPVPEVPVDEFAEAKKTVQVQMLTADWCGWCDKAKQFMKSEGIDYVEYDVEKSSAGRRYKQEWNTTGVPAFKIGDRIIGGYSPQTIENAMVAAYQKQQGQ